MPRRLRSLCLAVAAAALLVAGAVPAGASSVTKGFQADAARPPAAVDAMLMRPLGFVATVVGTGVFVLASPIFLATRPQDIGEPFKVLVARPAVWTWGRPIGGV